MLNRIMLNRRAAKAFATSPHIKRQHDECVQSCSGIPNVWVGVVSLMALIVLMVDSPKALANLFQLRNPEDLD